MPTLNLLRFLLLSILLDWKSGITAYRGIQHNVPTSVLHGIGCSLCFASKSDGSTSSADIESCRGPNLFVGLRSPFSSIVEIGAYAPAEVVQQKTIANSFHSHGGVGWHYSSGSTFGFVGNLSTDSARSFDQLSENTPNQMIWKIDDVHRDDTEGVSHRIVSKSSRVIFNCPAASSLTEGTSNKILRRDQSDSFPRLDQDCNGHSLDPLRNRLGENHSPRHSNIYKSFSSAPAAILALVTRTVTELSATPPTSSTDSSSSQYPSNESIILVICLVIFAGVVASFLAYSHHSKWKYGYPRIILTPCGQGKITWISVLLFIPKSVCMILYMIPLALGYALLYVMFASSCGKLFPFMRTRFGNPEPAPKLDEDHGTDLGIEGGMAVEISLGEVTAHARYFIENPHGQFSIFLPDGTPIHVSPTKHTEPEWDDHANPAMV